LRRLRAQLIVCLLFAAPPAANAAGKSGYIATPDACYVPEKVAGETVYLKRVGVCGGQPGRAFVQTERQTLKVMVDGKFWQEVRVEEMSVPDVAATLAQADRLAGTLPLPQNRHEEEMKAVAGKLDAYYRSDEFQGRVRSETERIKAEVFGESYARFYPDSVKGEGKGRLAESERVYIFVSSSMPLQTVRNYVASVARLGDPRIVMVIRGFVNGMSRIQPTIRFVADALKKDPLCSPSESECGMLPANLVVDPLLYRRYAIDRVPAVVFARGVRAENPGLSEGDIKNTDISDSYSLYGDASLEYILQAIQRESGASSLKELLAAGGR
jgi:type-F conjugative transfer system pilin assembly protein TrbC